VCPFWTLCSHVCDRIYPGKLLKTSFASPGKPWNLGFTSPGKSWKTVFYCLYEPWIGMIDDHDECSGWMFLLVPAHPGCPGQNPNRRKTVVCVCVLDQVTLNYWIGPVQFLPTRGYVVIVCPSVSPSAVCHTPVLCQNDWVCRITLSTPHNSPGTLAFWRQRSWQNSNGFTPTDTKCRWGRLKCATFDK